MMGRGTENADGLLDPWLGICRANREKDQEKKELRAWEECGQVKPCRKGTAVRGLTHWRRGKGAGDRESLD